jgi:hypothetical protein
LYITTLFKKQAQYSSHAWLKHLFLKKALQVAFLPPTTEVAGFLRPLVIVKNPSYPKQYLT